MLVKYYIKLVVLCGFFASVLSVRHHHRGRMRHGKSHKSNNNNSDNFSPVKCPPCEQISCPKPRRVSKLKKICKGGITTGVCNCCDVCAKILGEPCGGEYNYLGKCDKGLFCHSKPRMKKVHDDIPEGKCRKDHENRQKSSFPDPKAFRDEGTPNFCQPKCSPKYCKDHPKAICAAFDVAEQTRSCQGECQHTSCSACRFVNEQADCGKCAKDDFGCIKRFAKCIKKQVCTRNKFPCRTKKNNEKGKFMCAVARCLDSYS